MSKQLPSEKEFRLVCALAGMYEQYCGGDYGHDFMGAGEDACEVLGWYGLMTDKEALDEVAYAEFEKQGYRETLPNNNGSQSQEAPDVQ